MPFEAPVTTATWPASFFDMTSTPTGALRAAEFVSPTRDEPGRGMVTKYSRVVLAY
jgi:hypothetical protein